MTNLSSVPVRPFGFGLSYTTYLHGKLEIVATGTDQGVTVALDVTNTGAHKGTEVVQLFSRDSIATVTRPVAELVGFARVELAPGETKRVTFTVPPARLSFTNRNLDRVVEPGEFWFWTGDAHAGMVPAGHEEPKSTSNAGSVVLTGEAHRVELEDPRVTSVRFAA